MRHGKHRKLSCAIARPYLDYATTAKLVSPGSCPGCCPLSLRGPVFTARQSVR